MSFKESIKKKEIDIDCQNKKYNLMENKKMDKSQISEKSEQRISHKKIKIKLKEIPNTFNENFYNNEKSISHKILTESTRKDKLIFSDIKKNKNSKLITRNPMSLKYILKTDNFIQKALSEENSNNSIDSKTESRSQFSGNEFYIVNTHNINAIRPKTSQLNKDQKFGRTSSMKPKEFKGKEYNDVILPKINENKTGVMINKKRTYIEKNDPLELSFGAESSAVTPSPPNVSPNKENKNRKSYTVEKKLKDFKKIQSMHNNMSIQNKIHHKKIFSNDYSKVKDDKIEIGEFKLYSITNNLNIDNLFLNINDYKKVKCSSSDLNNIIKCYAVNTYKGKQRIINEDKVSIILKISRPKKYNGYWPKASFIALYCGTKGKSCSNYLRDELHNYILKSKYFPKEPKKAILSGFKHCESDYLLNTLKKKFDINSNCSEGNNKNLKDKDFDNNSGSTAIILLIIDDTIFISNCGDSRALLSINQVEEIKCLNKLHKPSMLINPEERNRVINNGGEIYISKNNKEIIKPGEIEVTRGFGFEDIKTDLKKKIIIATPEITELKYKSNFDFIMLLSNSIFENYSNEEITQSLLNVIQNHKKLNIDNIHSLGSACVDMILKTSILKNSTDNITSIFIGFNNFENCLKHQENIITQNKSLTKESRTKFKTFNEEYGYFSNIHKNKNNTNYMTMNNENESISKALEPEEHVIEEIEDLDNIENIKIKRKDNRIDPRYKFTIRELLSEIPIKDQEQK